MRITLRSVALASLALALAGCGSSTSTSPNAESGEVPVTVNAIGTPVAMVVITVTASDIASPLVFNFPLSDGEAGGVLHVPPGPSRTITAQAFDVDGELLAEGSETRAVYLGANEATIIVLQRPMGAFPVAVSFGPVLIYINPRAATLMVGQSLQLEANVRSAWDVFLTSTPSWATANPAIATVTPDGVVTAVREGSTEIVAVAFGSATHVPITVVAP